LPRYVVVQTAESHSRLRPSANGATAGTMLAMVLSLLMLVAIALGAGGLYFIVRRKDYKRGWLMIVAAVVMLANVAIMTAPME